MQKVFFLICPLLCCSGTQSSDGHDEERPSHLQHQGMFKLLTETWLMGGFLPGHSSTAVILVRLKCLDRLMIHA